MYFPVVLVILLFIFKYVCLALVYFYFSFSNLSTSGYFILLCCSGNISTFFM